MFVSSKYDIIFEELGESFIRICGRQYTNEFFLRKKEKLPVLILDSVFLTLALLIYRVNRRRVAYLFSDRDV